jgi:hypothetical protein
MRRRPLAGVLSLILAMGSRAVYAVPAEAEAELRAVSCCTQHTGRPSSVPDARQCCAISSDADAPAALGAATIVPPSHAMAFPGEILVPTPRILVDGSSAIVNTSRDGPPRYLTLLTIRR